MELSTTLRLCREHGAYYHGAWKYELFANALGPEWGDDQPISLTTLLDLDARRSWNGVGFTIWALGAVPDEQREARDRVAANFCAHILGTFSGPSKQAKAVQVLRAFAVGQATADDVKKAAGAAMSAWRTRAIWSTLLFWPTRMTSWCMWLLWEDWTAWNTASAAFFARDVVYFSRNAKDAGWCGVKDDKIAAILRDSLACV